MKLTDINLNGFRAGHSTADATQVMVRLEEDAEDLGKKKRRRAVEKESGIDLVSRFLDLKQTYTRVNKPGLWRVLKKYGLKG